MSVIDKAPETLCHCDAIRQAARRVTRLYDKALAPADLRVTQLSVLAALARLGPRPMGVLADHLGMDRATLGHNLRPLEIRGLIDLTAGEDRRSRVIALTVTGRAALAGALPLWRAAQERFESVLGRQAAAAMRTAMAGLARLDFDGIGDGARK